MSRPRQIFITLLGAVALAAGAFVSQLGNPRFLSMLDFSSRSSASVRLQVWATDLLMLREHWLAGIGLGEYSHKYLSFVSRIFSPPLETAILHGHSLFFQFGLELGLFGWGFLVCLGIVVIRWIAQSKIASLAPAIAALIAILAHGLVDTGYWKNDLAAVFWVIIAVIYLGYNQASKPSSKTHD